MRNAAALYCRVSTNDQRIDLQLDALRTLAEQRGWIVAGEYVDKGISGSKDRRPELDRLMADVHQGKIDLVVCWRFDRFARSVRHLVTALEEFKTRGVDFVSLSDSIDTSTSTGRFTFVIIGAVAELEREILRERTRAGLAAARRKGKRLGRRRAVIDVDHAQRLKDQGFSLRAVAEQLHVGLGTLHRALAAVPETSLEAVSQPVGTSTPKSGRAAVPQTNV